MFRGRYEHAIDAKGRTSLPAKFREVLAQAGETRLVVTTGLESCLVAYPMQEWLAFEERLAKLPQFDPQVAQLRRIFLSGAVDVDIDRLGRLLIPSTLRSHAHLDREALWAGMGRFVELWSKERWGHMQERASGDDAKRTEMAKRLAELGL